MRSLQWTRVDVMPFNAKKHGLLCSHCSEHADALLWQCGGLALQCRERQSSIQPMQWTCRYFALAMTSMEDYEREIEPLKRRLHRTALTPDCAVLELGMGTGPNLRYQAACPVCASSYQSYLCPT